MPHAPRKRRSKRSPNGGGKQPPNHSIYDHSSRRTGLARALSKLGLCSRTKAQELIRAGRVRLNGIVRHDPETPVHLDRDRIDVNGRPTAAAKKVYLALNKPRGVVTTSSDEKGRQTVYDFVDRDTPWVAPVGRLDKASEGLLLLTNDSEWAARVIAPETHLEKIYHVQIAAIASEGLQESLRRGVRQDGDLLRAVRVRLLRSGGRNSWLEIVLDQGRNRQIRRMFEALGVEVLRLVRVGIGPLPLGDLPKGKTRALTPAEKLAMDNSVRSRTRLTSEP